MLIHRPRRGRSIGFGLAALVGAAVLEAFFAVPPAAAWDRGSVETLAVLPDGATGPEGITLGPDGNLYVSTFGFSATGADPGSGKIYVLRENDGKLVRTLTVTGSTSHLLGLAFHPTTGALLVIDSGGAKVLNVNPQTGASSLFTSVPGSVLNALTFDSAGNVYISDSGGGKIWKTGPAGGAASVWASSSDLLPNGTPPFGANGLQFNKNQSAMFVANTATDQIIRIPASGSPLAAGTPVVYVNSVNGADGLILDGSDNIWVAANQSDEIVVLDPSGKAIAKLGDFEGLTKDGTPRGLLFPASPVFSKDKQWLYVTNLALDIRLFMLPQSDVSQYAAQVKHYTVSKLKAKIPPFKSN